MNPLDTCLGITLPRQMTQACAGLIVGAAVARGEVLISTVESP